jgi:hypothetical protein
MMVSQFRGELDQSLSVRPFYFLSLKYLLARSDREISSRPAIVLMRCLPVDTA